MSCYNILVIIYKYIQALIQFFKGIFISINHYE